MDRLHGPMQPPVPLQLEARVSFVPGKVALSNLGAEYPSPNKANLFKCGSVFKLQQVKVKDYALSY